MGNIKDFFKYHSEDSLIRDSATLFICTSGLSVAGFLFHFYMGRELGPSSYGVLGTVFSLFYLFLVGFFVIQTTITNFVSIYNAKNEHKKINVLLRKSLYKFLIIGFFVTLFFIIISKPISNFLNIEVKYLLFIAPLIFFSFSLPITRGVMQGLELFKKLGINMTYEGLAKLFFGVFFVYIGFGVGGAIFALVLSYTIPFILSFYTLKEYFKKEEDSSVDIADVYKYSIPVIISLLIFTGFYTVDFLLVKHFFSEDVAGLYAALSFLGKIIFFGTQSISVVMFPKSVANYTVKKENKKILTKALGIVTILGSAGVLVYFLFPKLAITILYGKDYLSLTNVLGLYGLFMLILSLGYVLMLYNLSLNRKKFIYILVLFLILETLGVYFFHQTIREVILIALVLMSLMFIILLFYTYNGKTINNNPSIQ